jgi:hypothetical protein
MAIPSWLTLSKTSDSDGGTDTVTATCQSNVPASGGRGSSSSERSCTLTVTPTYGGGAKTVQVVQAGAAAPLTLEPKEDAYKGGTINIGHDTLFTLAFITNAKAVQFYTYDGEDVVIVEGAGYNYDDGENYYALDESAPPTPNEDDALIQQQRYYVIPSDIGMYQAFLFSVDFDFKANDTGEVRQSAFFFDYHGDGGAVKTLRLTINKEPEWTGGG